MHAYNHVLGGAKFGFMRNSIIAFIRPITLVYSNNKLLGVFELNTQLIILIRNFAKLYSIYNLTIIPSSCGKVY